MKLYVFPGNIEEDILRIGAQQIPYMRTTSFSMLVKECEQWLLELMKCTQGRVLSYTASGTGAMDAVVANYVTQKKKAFIIAGGSFGYRWKELCEYYACDYKLFEVPFAKDIDYDCLEESIKAAQPDIFLCQHHETSTGQLYNLEKIAAICRQCGASLVVDAISSFLADPLDMDGLGIDVCITSSQKGLNIAPGLSFIVLSARMQTETFAHKGYYFDFKENLRNLERGQTPYSPATTLFMQLHARLQKDIRQGVDSIVCDINQKALYFRRLCRMNGWEVPAENPSNCITGFFVRRNGNILFTELLKKNIYIMPGGTPNYFRISHLGIQSCHDLDQLAACIKEIENY